MNVINPSSVELKPTDSWIIRNIGPNTQAVKVGSEFVSVPPFGYLEVTSLPVSSNPQIKIAQKVVEATKVSPVKAPATKAPTNESVKNSD